ncbi:MAG: hypothetical protein ABSH48_13890 [Verrucomicrobiota bacterium]|jgi:hypothetical protein
MNKKAIQLIISVVSLAAVGSANATLTLQGGLAAGGTGSFTSDSLTLNALQLVESATGDFSPAVQSGSELTANTTTISGLSTTALVVSVPDYFSFSSTLIAPGTSPSDRFEFNLASLTETSDSGGLATFSGTGTLVDTTGAYASAPATFTLGFSGSAGESFSMDTEPSVAPVPEPSTLIAGAAMLLPFGVGAFRALRKGRKN